MWSPPIKYVCVCSVLLLWACDDNPVESHSAPESRSVLTITTPAHGEKLLAADTVTVGWSESLGEYDLSWRRDGDTSAPDEDWMAVSAVAQTPESLRFVVPAIYSDTITLKLVDDTEGDRAFVTCRLRHFILTDYPPADARYAVGDTIEIAWRISPLLSSALIELLYDGGRNSTPVNTDRAVTVPDTSYTWVIGQESDFSALYPVEDCYLRVTDYGDEDYYDHMDHTFDIDR